MDSKFSNCLYKYSIQVYNLNDDKLQLAVSHLYINIYVYIDMWMFINGLAMVVTVV